MIKKFQQGGQADQAIMQFVQGIAQELQADPQQVVQAAQQNPEALKAAVQVFQETQDIKQAAQTFVQAVQQKTQAAKHGAKLNYIKSLKHQCAEDEEVYYFKKGGSVGCGCRKKEDGGEVTKASKGCSAIKKFKASYGTKFPESKKPNSNASKVEQNFLKDRDKYRLKKQKEEEAYKKRIEGYNRQYQEDQDANVGEEREKKPIVKKSCGSKLKKHFNGGSLNRIPFIKVELQKKA